MSNQLATVQVGEHEQVLVVGRYQIPVHRPRPSLVVTEPLATHLFTKPYESAFFSCLPASACCLLLSHTVQYIHMDSVLMCGSGFSRLLHQDFHGRLQHSLSIVLPAQRVVQHTVRRESYYNVFMIAVYRLLSSLWGVYKLYKVFNIRPI